MDKYQFIFSVLQFSMPHISGYKGQCGASAVRCVGYVIRDLLLPSAAFEQLLGNSRVPDRTN